MTDAERIAKLEAKVRELQRALRPPSIFPLHWKLSPSEGRFVAMISRTGECTHEAAEIALRAGEAVIDSATVRSKVASVRRKLKKVGCDIISAWGLGGYCIPPEHLPIIRSALRAALDEEN